MTPVNIAISVVPFLDIPAQTCTDGGCFGFGLGTEGSPSRRNCLGRNLSHRTVLSSVKIQSLNSSLRTNTSLQKKSFFLVFSANHLTVPGTRLNPAHSSSLSVDNARRNVNVQFFLQTFLQLPCTNFTISVDLRVDNSKSCKSQFSLIHTLTRRIRLLKACSYATWRAIPVARSVAIDNLSDTIVIFPFAFLQSFYTFYFIICETRYSRHIVRIIPAK